MGMSINLSHKTLQIVKAKYVSNKENVLMVKKQNYTKSHVIMYPRKKM